MGCFFLELNEEGGGADFVVWTTLSLLTAREDRVSTMARDVKAYLTQRKGESPTPEIAQHWVNLEQYYNKR